MKVLKRITLKFINLISTLFFKEFILSDKEKELVKKIDENSKILKKYGGKMVVGNRGGMRLEFKTKQGEIAYHQYLRKKFKDDCKQQGYKNNIYNF